jgi:flagellar hook-associated protein 1 FlgK
MSGLISNLATSSKALGVHSKGLEIAGKNLANINNRNYAKQRVEIGDRGSIGTGIATESMGVEAMELRQNRDVLLDKSVMREFTASSGLEAAKKILESAESALGQFLDRTKDSTSIQNANGSNGGGISDSLSDFFNAWESYSVKPNDVAVKQLLIEKAKILADKINITDERLGDVQSNVDGQIASDLIDANGILKTLAEINGYIAKAENGKPNSAVDLRDQRQAKLEELSKYMDISFENIADSNGQIRVKSGDVILVEGKDVSGDGELAYVNTTTDKKFTFGGADLSISKGALVSQLEARNGAVQDSRNRIAVLAKQLQDSINGVYSPTGDNFFKDAVSTAVGKLLEIDADLKVSSLKSTSTTNAGANDVALKIADLANKPFATPPSGADSIDGTFGGFYNSIVSSLGQKLSTNNIQLEDQKLSEEMTRSNRDSFSGVSQDEEMTDMMKFQRSFQASSRFINVVDNLLDQVVNRLGSF